MKVRCCLDHDRLVPKPAELPEELRQGGFGPPVVRRAYIAATGWLSPTELKRRFPEERGAWSPAPGPSPLPNKNMRRN
ncbi:hypothetical protein [uncultured Oscillibacter sp.]|uniref:hypothetical protein n=1 Tax=uncultured Oscillibacter sp. TaxID=876091 RepID=UPI00260BADCF|nr:hypothetical protein [uncultured Oscillibacter sp.]